MSKHHDSTASAVPTLLRRMNERRVLETLMRFGPQSRADLTRVTGISAPTISKAVAMLVEAGLIEEQDVHENKTGRPGRLYSLATAASQMVGVVIGPKHCHVAASGLDCKITEERATRFDTPDTYNELLDEIVENVRKVVAMHKARVLGVCVTVPSVVDPQTHPKIDAPALPLIHGRPLGADLSKRLKLRVIVTRQSQALCLAQRLAEPARSLDSFAFIDASDSLAMGVVIGGQLYRGQQGNTGALGRLRLNGSERPLEETATDAAFAHEASEQAGQEMSIEQAIDRMRSGDESLNEIVDVMLDNLSGAVAAVIDLFNTPAVFVHGQVLESDEEVMGKLTSRVRRMALGDSMDKCRVYAAAVALPLAPLAAFLSDLVSAQGPLFL